jgi:hypothetical protein
MAYLDAVPRWAIVGVFAGTYLVVSAAGYVVWRIWKRRFLGLSDIQKAMLVKLGYPSDGTMAYRALVSLIGGGSRDPDYHSAREGLMRRGLVLYYEGRVMMTAKGWEAREIIARRLPPDEHQSYHFS